MKNMENGTEYKIKQGFLLREVSGTCFVVPIASREIDFQKLSTLNKTAVFLWKRCEDGATREELITALYSHYEVDSETAAQDVDAFLKKARESGFLE